MNDRWEMRKHTAIVHNPGNAYDDDDEDENYDNDNGNNDNNADDDDDDDDGNERSTIYCSG